MPQATRNCKISDNGSSDDGMVSMMLVMVVVVKWGKVNNLISHICCVPGYEKLLFVFFSSRLSRLSDDGVDDVCDNGDDVVYVDVIDGDDGGGKNEHTSTTQ